jgi:DUF1009 family protein
MTLMPDDQRTIGVIAGNGIYPETFLKAARPHGVRLVVCAFEGETRKDEVEELADEVIWLRVGQLKKMIKFFTGQGAKEAVMVGQIDPKNLFNLRPDLRMIGMLAKLKEKNAESLFGAIAGELSKDGIELLSATTFLEEFLPGPGPVCGPGLDQKALEDAAYGFRIAKETSRLNIGQTVVVREGTVLAVEAFEGTNSCIKRGGELGKGKNVKVIKVTKPNQDFRFDVPVVGPETILTCVDANISTIVVEAGCTLILGVDEVRELCGKHRVSLHAMSGSDEEA